MDCDNKHRATCSSTAENTTAKKPRLAGGCTCRRSHAGRCDCDSMGQCAYCRRCEACRSAENAANFTTSGGPEPQPRTTAPAPPVRKRVLLIRHGESVANVEGSRTPKVPDHLRTLDAPLTAQGLRQALSWAELSASWGAEVVLVSPLARAMQTADAVFRDDADIPMELLPAIRERWWQLPECRGREEYEGELQQLVLRRFGAGGLERLRGVERGWDRAWEARRSGRWKEGGVFETASSAQRSEQRTVENAGLDGLAAVLLARPEATIVLSTHYGVLEKLLGVHAKNCEVFVTVRTQRVFCDAILYYKRSFYQDRLGTNIGKLEEKHVSAGAFGRGRMAGAGDLVTYSSVRSGEGANERDYERKRFCIVLQPSPQ